MENKKLISNHRFLYELSRHIFNDRTIMRVRKRYLIMFYKKIKYKFMCIVFWVTLGASWIFSLQFSPTPNIISSMFFTEYPMQIIGCNNGQRAFNIIWPWYIFLVIRFNEFFLKWIKLETWFSYVLTNVGIQNVNSFLFLYFKQ